MSYIFFNNKIVDEESALISVQDRGFLFGDGLFETLRSYDGYIFNLSEHISRLKASAESLRIMFDYSEKSIESTIDQLIVKNNHPDAYIRMTLSRGPGIAGGGFKIPDNDNKSETSSSSTFFIQVKPLSPYPQKFYDNGMSLVVSGFKRSISCPVSKHKSANFLTNILARDEAVQKNVDDSILLNSEGFVAECSASNLFIVKNGTVVTPPLSVNILPGITRMTVLNICKREEIAVEEEAFKTEELIHADECFITNSLMEIMPVCKVEETNYKGPIPGKVTKRLMMKYKQMTGKGVILY